MTTGRNDPCPCGSGRKFKHCHLAADQAPHEAGRSEVSPLHEMDNRLSDVMMAFAESRFGAEMQIDEQFQSLDSESGIQLLLPWILYIAPVRGRRVVDWFLESRSWSLTPAEVEWLEAQRRSWLSVWEILEVDPGRGFRLRDLLTLEERFVEEVKGSLTAVPRLTILCRVVDAQGTSVMAGAHPQPLPPLEGAAVVQQIRRKLRRKGTLPIELVGRSEVASLIAHAWDDALLAQRNRPAPRIQNTDGDELLLTTDRFRFDSTRREEIEAALGRVDNLEREPGTKSFILRRPDKGGRTFTILGRLAMGKSELTAETNSIARADALRAILEEACGPLLGRAIRSHIDPLSERARAAAPPSSPPSEELAGVVRQYKANHYEQWLDDPIPALGGKTPIQAARSKNARKQLDALLKDIEYHESQLPERERFDVAVLRQKLGLS
jgi:hypothetical protein